MWKVQIDVYLLNLVPFSMFMIIVKLFLLSERGLAEGDM